MTAARTGNAEAVEALLARGADPNATERNAQTALMWASAEGHEQVVKALIAGGADLKATLDSGFNPFFFAVREGHADVARALLAAGYDVNEALQRRARPQYQHADSGMSPLILAIENGHFELAVALLEAGADPNDERTGYTPLHTITWVRKPKNSDYGSDPAPEGSGNLSSLQFVRALVAMGADVNRGLANGKSIAPKINIQGATPFLFAADKADVPLMKTLLDLGADPMLPNVEGTTPLMAAAGLGTTAPLEEAGTEQEAYEATKLLLSLGADIDAVDGNGEDRDARRRLRELSDSDSLAGRERRRSRALEAAQQARLDAPVHRRGLPAGQFQASTAGDRDAGAAHGCGRDLDRGSAPSPYRNLREGPPGAAGGQNRPAPALTEREFFAGYAIPIRGIHAAEPGPRPGEPSAWQRSGGASARTPCRRQGPRLGRELLRQRVGEERFHGRVGQQPLPLEDPVSLFVEDHVAHLLRPRLAQSLGEAVGLADGHGPVRRSVDQKERRCVASRVRDRRGLTGAVAQGIAWTGKKRLS